MLIKNVENDIDDANNIFALTEPQVEQAVAFLLNDKSPTEDKAEFLSALNNKGISPKELALFAKTFLQYSVKIKLSKPMKKVPKIDMCGTGGDKLDLFNVSTAASFVVASAGINVAKHGNRSVTSKCGGADVLEQLGVRIDLQPEALADCLEATGFAFVFAQMYHPAFKSVAPARKLLAERGEVSIFNSMGPLLNPLKPDYQLIGIYDHKRLEDFAKILKFLGRKRAWVVNGKVDVEEEEEEEKSMDEVSTLGETDIAELDGSNLLLKKITHSDLENIGIKPAKLEDLRGGTAKENARIITNILSGKEKGAKRDIVLLNSAAGLMVMGKADELSVAVKTAKNLLDSGAANDKLNEIKEFCKKA